MVLNHHDPLVIIVIIIIIPVDNANSVDPDQTPRSVASDMSLLCLHMSLLWDARLKCIKAILETLLTYKTNICCVYSLESPHRDD